MNSRTVFLSSLRYFRDTYLSGSWSRVIKYLLALEILIPLLRKGRLCLRNSIASYIWSFGILGLLVLVFLKNQRLIVRAVFVLSVFALSFYRYLRSMLHKLFHSYR